MDKKNTNKDYDWQDGAFIPNVFSAEKEKHIKKVLSFLYDVCAKQERLEEEETLWAAYVSLFKPRILNRNGFSVVYQGFKDTIYQLS